MIFNREFIKQVGPLKWAARTALRQFHKRVIRYPNVITLPTGARMRLPIDSHFATEVFVTGADVDWGSERLLSMVCGNGVFLDVGANIGYYSLYIAPKASAVYSFEPDPRSLRNLEENVRNHPKVEIVRCAVGCAPGRARFVMAAKSELSHIAGEAEDGHTIEVEVVTLDAFVAEKNLIVTAIKIDAEGHELEVIEGATATIVQQSPVILVEANPDDQLFKIADTFSYHLAAYVCQRRTRKISFVELRPGVPIREETKMVFLVPGHLLPAVRRNA